MSAPGELEYVPIGTNQHITSKKTKKKKKLFRSLSPNIPPTFTLLEAVFCRNVSRSPPLAALLWIVLVCVWTHRRDTSAHGMAGLIRYRFRERIRVAWYECRRHRQPDYEYFSSQWMPPGITVPLVSISPNRTSLVFHF